MFAGSLEVAATASVLGMLAVFAADNMAVIALRKNAAGTPRPFTLPYTLFGFAPLSAVLGLLSCVLLFTYTAWNNREGFILLFVLLCIGVILRSSTSARKKRERITDSQTP